MRHSVDVLFAQSGSTSQISSQATRATSSPIIAPLRYAVDLTRAVYYQGQPAAYNRVVLASPLLNLLLITAMFAIFLVVGTILFVRSERNK